MEIEYKFLCSDDFNIRDFLYTESFVIKDIYLNDNIRIRNINDKEEWILTYKSIGTKCRAEEEYKIYTRPNLNSEHYPVLLKNRYIIPYLNQKFEVNIFNNILYEEKPLVVIELEVDDINAKIQKPEWLGKEITNDPRFYGYNLAKLLTYKFFKVI